ncbi:hypothetical protein UP17_24005 [Peribacillus simplex]|nr:hypothetical protein UP17_24005 [Peribacillus simplex]
MHEKKRMEELISDLIRHVAKTHVKTSNNEYELVQINLMLTQLKTQNKYLYEHNEKLMQRISALEQSIKYSDDEKTSLKLDCSISSFSSLTSPKQI